MISLAILANLASIGQKIVVERDCIVVIAGHNESKLAKMNAVFRTIDLTSLVLSTTFAGIIFDFASCEMTAAVIGCWNLISVVFEFWLLMAVFKNFEELSSVKKIDKS